MQCNSGLLHATVDIDCRLTAMYSSFIFHGIARLSDGRLAMCRHCSDKLTNVRLPVEWNVLCLVDTSRRLLAPGPTRRALIRCVMRFPSRTCSEIWCEGVLACDWLFEAVNGSVRRLEQSGLSDVSSRLVSVVKTCHTNAGFLFCRRIISVLLEDHFCYSVGSFLLFSWIISVIQLESFLLFSWIISVIQLDHFCYSAGSFWLFSWIILCSVVVINRCFLQNLILTHDLWIPQFLFVLHWSFILYFNFN